MLYNMLCPNTYPIKAKVNQKLQGQSQGNIQNIFGQGWFSFVMGVSDMELINLPCVIVII